MRAERAVVLSALALVAAVAAVLVALAFRVDSNTTGVGTAKGTAKDATRKADRNAVSIADLKALGRRISANTRGINRKADRTETRGVRTQRSLTTLNRVVLGSPGASGVAGRSIVGPRGITGLTTTGPQGLPGSQGTPAVDGTNGTNGADGKDSTVAGPKGDAGDNGADSTVPGPPPTDAQVQAVVAAYLQTHPAACDLTPDPLDSPTAMACTFP